LNVKGRQIVIYDACVLYPAPLRSFLMYLALTDLFSARWTHEIHEEWMRAVEKDYPDITRAQLERVRKLMDSHVCDCLVTGYESLIPSLTLPDLDDRHVLAAAIHCGAQHCYREPGRLSRGRVVEARHRSVAPGRVCLRMDG
jgi:hypothetical protein